MERKFRLLNADEIDVRVSTVVPEKGVSLLLYKDARADMTILDETVGAENWQRRHTRDNANCIVSIWDAEKGQWIEKEDTGTESNTEKEKGLASDSFKRACTNWGIGRELYTSPFIWIEAEKIEWTTKNGKPVPKTRFKLASISYDDKGRINSLEIKTNKGTTVFTFGQQSAPTEKPTEKKPIVKHISLTTAKALDALIDKTGSNRAELLKYYDVETVNDLNAEQAKHCMGILKARADKQKAGAE